LKLIATVCVLATLALAQSSPSDWHGTFTANNRYGGVMYACPVGNNVYGVYSNAGFFEGTITGNTLTGNFWEGGRGYRNDYQGSFKISLASDNLSFDGFYTRVSEDGKERRWHESRLGSPYPSNPTHDECLVPFNAGNVIGSFFREADNKDSTGAYHICRDQYEQVYGSFDRPDGYIEGWSVRGATGFQGYRYEGNGSEGAYILRATSATEARGFYWNGPVVRNENQLLSQPEALYRSNDLASIESCEQFGPGFLQRLRNPDNANGNGNSSSTLAAGLVSLIAAIFVLFF